jgi:DNA-binding NarL/FixJ family response regulator
MHLRAFDEEFALLRNILTSCQMAVLQLLARGKSNKIIAHELGMSESAVRVQVQTIIEKMRALRSYEEP